VETDVHEAVMYQDNRAETVNRWRNDEQILFLSDRQKAVEARFYKDT
jgi:hypothetical protein